MNITTTYKTNHNGTGQIVAKGGGKQRTVDYDQTTTPERNHGIAAGTLGLVLFEGRMSRQIAARAATHTDLGNGQHRFTVNI